MTIVPSVDPARFLGEQLDRASPDLLREMLTTFISVLLSADAKQLCGTSYGTVSDDRVNRSNGYRYREVDTPPSKGHGSDPPLLRT
ncbi:transposase [Microbacterium esteraromaticum]|nr:transposase [Microbacterium esteraromaticum]WDH78191.1 transposase [Microbacterium esteraromaticum]